MEAIIISLAICFTHQFVFPFAEANNGGFTVELIHRDSPHSPVYNLSETTTERFHKAYLRSISRLNNHFNIKAAAVVAASPEALQAPMVSSGGEYYINISIGTPRIELIGIADTASDLTWIQCKPCQKCYKQNPPIFDPRKSSTSNNITCNSKSCLHLGKDKRCDINHNTCLYLYSYADGSYGSGNVGTESFTISSKTGPPVTFPNIVFGCGNNNSGVYDETGSGIVGLGDGPLSLISQISESIQAKFSYCLVPTSAQGNATSKINFGETGLVPESKKVIATRLVHKEASTYYHVTLKAISVGNKRVEYFTGNATGVGEEGNMIIDTGTTFTFLDPQFYEVMATVLEKQIGSKRVKDPRGYASACFEVTEESHDDDDVIPSITFHFDGEADLELHKMNAFSRLEREKLMCLNMLPVDPIGVFGNLSQMDFLIQFDLVKRTVSFMPTDCTKQ